MTVWGPIALVTAHALFMLWADPIGDAESGDIYAPSVVMGVMLCQPLICAFWAAWTWHPAVWRLPLGAAACALLGLAACAKGGSMEPLTPIGLLFLLFLAVFLIARATGRWRFAPQWAAAAAPGGRREQFSVRYLLVWTTVVALLIVLGRVVGQGSRGFWNDSLAELLAVLGVFISLLLPVIAAGVLPLGRVPRWWAGLIGLPLGVAAVSLAAAMIITEGMSPGERFWQIWGQVACFSVGATLAMLFSALVLRGAGYRVVRHS